jgi:KinB signaling pathway activation protein
MTRDLRTYLELTAAILTGTAAFQAFRPGFCSRGTNWAYAPGWQREIAFWDLAVGGLIAKSLLQNDRATARNLAGLMLGLHVLLGTNHLLSIRSGGKNVTHAVFALVNGLGLVLGSNALAGDRRLHSRYSTRPNLSAFSHRDV